MPTVGDVVQGTIVWDIAGGGEALNVFKMQLTQVNVNDWEAIGDDFETFMTAAYTDWLDNVATNINSVSIALALRDAALGRWDTVLIRAFSALVGDAVGGTTQSINTGSVIAYPQTVRNWGRKALPPPSEGAISDGVLTAQAVLDLLIFGSVWTDLTIATNSSWINGVYTEADELFRPFTGDILGTQIGGSQVTRKFGRGS